MVTAEYFTEHFFMPRLRLYFISLLIILWSAVPAFAQAQKPGVLVELFTSQSCSSCPPAEAFFRELSGEENLVVIEWHVDYWDQLVHGRAGKWKDPYSKAEYTLRQRLYNRSIRHQNGVYTPQAIVAGRFETVGSSRQHIRALIERAPPPEASIQITPSNNGHTVTIQSFTAQPNQIARSVESSIIFVRLQKQQETEVKRGENHGRKLTSNHVALERQILGVWDGTPATYQAPDLKETETCAVIIQEGATAAGGIGHALSAAYCPE